ncbi:MULTISPECIES: hypothetical protein [Micrococcaceae]|uniref:Uncharacterized protein n=1 Tax=Glutamicibacter soli TaxID=453836 RepID=A0A365YBL9_9MICC|nr:MULTISPECIES: hypothetical protein [Micrococcaceae]ALD62750.1 hypothetical protein AFL94_00855 [Arthrobacter sp. LS16]ALQ32092.1 hypothetical protein ATC04_17155 [Arthrobacter sp. YC-RL1]KLI90388.1 hypothetical protein AA310_03345 [Arthrobacter sp. YC-RL1]RBL99958.1 hypothetical protein C1H84_12485 [Glutamicibacter soli]RKS17469.1 hypothetical protein DFO58_3093 [Arthrobacter sp. AG1021]
MHRNQSFAALTGGVIASLTVVVSLSPSFWVILLGSLVLVIGFSTLAKLERFWGPASSGSYFYVAPMVVGPAAGGLLRDTQYAGWAGAAVGLLCGLAAYLLIMKSPPFAEPGADEEADENYFLNVRESSRS